MTLQGQLAQSAHSQMMQPLSGFLSPGPGFEPLGGALPAGPETTVEPSTPTSYRLTSPSQTNPNAGLLGNKSIQAFTTIYIGVSGALHRFLTQAQPGAKLALLKRSKFTPEGRQERIAASLAALNAPQPTNLTLTQWKEILEEVEDED